MKVLGYITALVISIALSTMWSGYALSILWSWFVVPPFGAPALSIPYAIGLASVVSYLTQSCKSSKDDKSFGDTLIEGCVVGALKPALALLFGYVIHLFC